MAFCSGRVVPCRAASSLYSNYIIVLFLLVIFAYVCYCISKTYRPIGKYNRLFCADSAINYYICQRKQNKTYNN